jgi:RNase P/RNase MRP subunit POP5
LLKQLRTLQHVRYEQRAFVYFDIISWLESKIHNRAVGDVIREKALKRIGGSG